MGGTPCNIERNVINAHYNNNRGGAVNLQGGHHSTRVRCNYFTDGQLVQDEDILTPPSVTAIPLSALLKYCLPDQI